MQIIINSFAEKIKPSWFHHYQQLTNRYTRTWLLHLHVQNKCCVPEHKQRQIIHWIINC